MKDIQALHDSKPSIPGGLGDTRAMTQPKKHFLKELATGLNGFSGLLKLSA